jgi:hypothetical protein
MFYTKFGFVCLKETGWKRNVNDVGREKVRRGFGWRGQRDRVTKRMVKRDEIDTSQYMDMNVDG